MVFDQHLITKWRNNVEIENHKKDSASYLKWQKFEKYVMGKQEKGFDILSEIEIHLFLYYVRKSLTYVNQ